jgi:hypothetical protein
MSIVAFDIVPQLNTAKGWGMLIKYLAVNSIVNGLINIGIDEAVGLLTGDDEEKDYIPYFIYGALPFGVISNRMIQKTVEGDLVEALGLTPAGISVFNQLLKNVVSDLRRGEAKRSLNAVPMVGDVLARHARN